MRDQTDGHISFEDTFVDKVREGTVLREGLEVKVRDVDKI